MDLPQSPGFRLDGKRALVTGASSGIGLAAAVALARAGAEVALVARREEALEALREALCAEGLSATAHPLDLADLDATARFLDAEAPFDVLLNAAGMARHGKAVDARTPDFDAVMNLNLRAAYFLTRAVAARLIDAGKPGSLINVSSQLGHVGAPERSVYCASKHALEGMTKAMAREFGPYGIRINTLCPTFVLTPLTQAAYANPEIRAWVKGKIAPGRVGQIEDMMGPAVFLASDASALMTGAALLIDGGWTAE